jgi:hypothetical protein
MSPKLLTTGLLAFLVPLSALAGPPILCNPLDIAKAKSLPMGSGPMEQDPGYSASKAEDDTMAILKSETSPLVRMETLRRATLYVVKDEAKAKDLLARIMSNALDALAAKNDTNAAAAMFDAGFLAACYGEMGLDLGWKPGAAEGAQGYGWIRSAIDKLPGTAPERAEMEFGAALAVHPMDHRGPEIRALYEAHLQRAAQGAKDGSLLAANLKAHHAKWDPYLRKENDKPDGKQAAKPDDGK